jgi:hypothetical protein
MRFSPDMEHPYDFTRKNYGEEDVRTIETSGMRLTVLRCLYL